MSSKLSFCLMLITDEGAELVPRVERALEGCSGPRVAVQVRLKHLCARDVLEAARKLRTITRARGVQLFINDRVDVALAVQADGVQLPHGGLDVATARTMLPVSVAIGRSCHSLAELKSAEAAGADYALLSPVHAVPGKGQALGIAHFGALTNQTSVPVVALGGLNADDVAPLTAQGAQGFAVIRAILGAADPARASAHFSAALAAAGHRTS